MDNANDKASGVEMFDLVYGPPTIDPDDDPDLLIERYSIEIAVMTCSPEPHLYNRGGKVIMRDGTRSRRAAITRLHVAWLEAYIKYIRAEYSPELTSQIALWAANDQGVTNILRTELRLGGTRSVEKWARIIMPKDFLNQINDDFGGLEKTCWLTVARELALR